MSVYKEKPGCVTLNLSTLKFDTEPTPGSPNLVESGAVAKFTDAVPEGTSPENPLVNESALAELELAMLKNIPCYAKTLRFKFSKMDYDPTVANVGSNGTWKKLIAKFHNVWDWSVSGTSFTDSFNNSFVSSDNYVEVIAAGDTSVIYGMARVFRNCTSLKKVCLFNTSSATSFRACFNGCTSLKEVPIFDFSSATSLYETFNGCSSLEKIPLFSTTSATDVTSMFNGCVKVKEGALDFYTQMSTQSTPPTTTTNCFKDCGKDTETGAAELAQIPASWGGTMPEP